MTDPAYPLMNGNGCSRGSPALTTPGIGMREAPVLGYPSCASCFVARMGRSRCKTTLPGRVSPLRCACPPNPPKTRFVQLWSAPSLVRQLLSQQLGDLGRVEGSPLTQVVTTDEQIDGVGQVQRLTDAPDEGRVRPYDVGRGRPLARSGVVQDHDARRLDQCLASSIGGQRSLEDGVHGERVGRDDRDPHTGRGDLEIGDAQDLTRLVADLELLRAPSAILEGTCPRHNIHGQRRGERRVLAELVADCRAHIAGVLTQLAVAGEYFDLCLLYTSDAADE